MFSTFGLNGVDRAGFWVRLSKNWLPEAAGQWKKGEGLVKINTEVHQQLAAQFGIRSIPSGQNGLTMANLSLSLRAPCLKAQIRQWLKENLPASQDDDTLAHEELLDQAIASGNRTETHRLLEIPGG